MIRLGARLLQPGFSHCCANVLGAIAAGTIFNRRSVCQAEPRHRQPLVSVMLGPSQSGKSTFLRLLHSMFGLPIPTHLEEGWGNESTTRSPQLYVIPAQQLEVTSPFSDSMGNLSAENFVESFCALGEYTANVRLAERAEPYTWKLLDTPGFDDSKENLDEEHQFNVLKELSQLGNVNAFIFVVGKGVHYGTSFKRVFMQYWNAFDRFQDRFIIVHTKWNPLDEGIQNEQEERIRAFQRSFPGLPELEHIFIDCKFGASRRFHPEQKKFYATVSINRALHAVAARHPVPVGGLAFRKTERMMAVEKSMIAFVNGQLEGANETLRTVQNRHASRFEEMTKEIAALEGKKAELKQVMEDLKSLDTDDFQIGGHRHTYFRGHWFTGSSTRVEVHCSSPVCKVEGVVDVAYTYAKWEDLMRSGNDAEGTLHSPWLAGHRGTLYAYVYRRDVHQAQIAKLKQQQEGLRCDIARMDNRVNSLYSEKSAEEETWKALWDRISFLSTCAADLKKTHVSLDEYLSTRVVYDQPSTVPAKDVFAMYRERKYSEN